MNKKIREIKLSDLTDWDKDDPVEFKEEVLTKRDKTTLDLINDLDDSLEKNLVHKKPTAPKPEASLAGIEFNRGYICALANLVQQYNISSMAEGALNELGIINWSEISSTDIEWLKNGNVNLKNYGYRNEVGI